MTFNGITKDYVKVLRGRERPSWAPVERNLIDVPGHPGGYLSNTKVKPRIITVPILIQANDFADLQKLKEDIADWLITNEPEELIFDDEPDRTYYALVDGELNLNEIVRVGYGVIRFVCPDPYKYGPETPHDFNGDASVIINNGTAEADPIFELTVKKPVTFAMIQNHEEEYMMIGTPTDVDEVVVDEKTKIVEERGQTLDLWDIPVTGFNGSFATTGDAIVIDKWGSGIGWHGAALMREIDPLEDFELEMYVYTRTEQPGQTFRMSTNFYDENNKELGMLRLWDKTTNQIRKVAEARVGPYTENYSNYLISDRNYNLQGQRVWGGIIRVKRVGNMFTFYTARITQGGRHESPLTETYLDSDNEFAGRLKFIRFDVANYGDTATPNEIRIEHIKVTRLNKVLVDQTPYIADVGDKIVFDNKDAEILLNGEDHKALKDFGSSYFKLAKGPNQLIVHPADSFDVQCKYKKRFR